MMRKGFIQRQTEMLATALEKILGLKDGGDREGALAELRIASKKLVGLDVDTTLTALPEQTIVALFTASDGGFDAGRCLAAAVLLAERAEMQEREEAARPLLQKALALLLEAIFREKLLQTAAYRARVEAIRVRLHGHPLPASLQQRLLRYDALEP